MKATTLISALVFAYGAFAQASESTSTSVSAGSVPASSSTATGGKSASKSGSQTSSAASTPTPQPSSTGGSDSLSESWSSSNGNPLIPSSISAKCSSFLTSLNADKKIADCLNPLSNAVSAYSTNSGSASGLSKTLDSLCAASNSCSRATLGAKLAEFNDNCNDELLASVKEVTTTYDSLYLVKPFTEAICSKVDGTYCLLDPKASSSVANTTSTTAPAANSGSSRRKRAQTVLVPNVQTFKDNNLMYLSTSPAMGKADLCTDCTKEIFARYYSFQQLVPHAMGIKNSPLLKDQSGFWSVFPETCGEGFVPEIQAVAGVASNPNDLDNSALPAFAGRIFTAVVGALAVVVALI